MFGRNSFLTVARMVVATAVAFLVTESSMGAGITVHFVPSDSAPSPGDQITIEAFVTNETGSSEELRAFQVDGLCTMAGGESGSVDAFTSIGGAACTGLPGETICDPGICRETVGSCSTVPFVHASRADYLFGLSGASSAPDYLCNPNIGVNSALWTGAATLPDQETRYLGTLIYDVSGDASGTFTLDIFIAILIDSDAIIIPGLVLEGATIVVESGCASNLDCDDGDPCTTDLCAGSCNFAARLHGDANNDGARNVTDVVCAARVTFQDATDCGGYTPALDEIDIAPGVDCGNGQLNITDVVAHARAAFQDAADECCGE